MRQKPAPVGLGGINPEKRDTLKKLAAGAAFAAPIVLSFSLGGLSVSDTRAYVGGADDRSIPPQHGNGGDKHGKGSGKDKDNDNDGGKDKGNDREREEKGDKPFDPPNSGNTKDKDR